MRWTTVLIACGGLACADVDRTSPIGGQLAASVAHRCADVPLLFTVESGDTAAERVAAETKDLVSGLGYEVDSALSSTALSPSDAQTLCALGEPPLAPGDSVLRLVRRPSFPVYGRSFVVRIQAMGGATELSAKVLGLCMLDSLKTVAPRNWDGSDTVIRLPDTASPGRIGFETRRLVERRLLLDALDYLDEKGFWTEEGMLPVPDATPTFLEVQLGQQYRVLQLPNFFAADAALFRLVQEAGLLEADCDEAADAVDYGWLVDDPWRVPAEKP